MILGMTHRQNISHQTGSQPSDKLTCQAILLDYLRLRLQPHLCDSDFDRLETLLNLAEESRWLTQWIVKLDELLMQPADRPSAPAPQALQQQALQQQALQILQRLEREPGFQFLDRPYSQTCDRPSFDRYSNDKTAHFPNQSTVA
jgi:hypothetical protein